MSEEISRRSALKIALAASAYGAASAAGAVAALADAWPDRPIKAISPISAGSASDVITRVVLDNVSAQLGQPIVVENRPGGDGTIAPADVARARPDGYTILSHSAAFTVAAATHSDLTYDTIKDFIPITLMARIPSVLVISPSKNIHSMSELIAAARTTSMNYASPGAFTQLNTERFLRSAGFEAQRIPFRGAPEALTEVVAGRVEFYFSPIFAALPLITQGEVVAIAVTGANRSSVLSNVPTFAEAGFAKADDNFWVGLFAPARTPQPIVTRVYQSTTAAIRSPAVVEKLGKFGAEPMTATPEEFAALFRQQLADNAALVKEFGISIN